jgi:hypothetical protein
MQIVQLIIAAIEATFVAAIANLRVKAFADGRG